VKVGSELQYKTSLGRTLHSCQGSCAASAAMIVYLWWPLSHASQQADFFWRAFTMTGPQLWN